MELQLTGDVHVGRSADELYDDLASILARAAMQAVQQRGIFHLALSGGSTPEPFYVRLVIDPQYRFLPWSQTHVWLVDERRVPEDDERANIRMIRESLTDHLPMRNRQVHAMPVLADDPATLYESDLREWAIGGDAADGLRQGGPPRLDFVLLGMGDDGHTASLFPHSPALDVADRWVTVNAGPHVTPPDRVTMTFPMVNAAREAAVLVTGAKKAATIHRVCRQLADHGPDPRTLPITGIDPSPQGGELTWFLDPEAAGA
jgi:6-phosphogluconolactonase